VCLLRGTDWIFIYNSTFCPHSVFVCFVWIWEQTVIISLHSINWLVFITEMESVSCALWTECLNINNPLKPSGTASLTFSNSTFCPHSVFMCFVWIWEQTAIISLYNISWLVFITETQCVYCAVRTGSLYLIPRSAHTVYLCPDCPLTYHRRTRMFHFRVMPYSFINNAIQFYKQCRTVLSRSFRSVWLKYNSAERQPRLIAVQMSWPVWDAFCIGDCHGTRTAVCDLLTVCHALCRSSFLSSIPSSLWSKWSSSHLVQTVWLG
jgi:hypothetical protein